MRELNAMYKALSAGAIAVVLLAGCASAKQVPATAEAAPAPAPTPATAPAAAPMAPADDIHVVVAGEHLWGISSYSQVYNDPYQWPLIFKRNRDQIQDADLIYPGQELRIQRDLTEAQVQQAIEHAKTRGAWSLGPTEQSDLDYLSRAF
jgi:nucleoid-associated protein YgaU